MSAACRLSSLAESFTSSVQQQLRQRGAQAPRTSPGAGSKQQVHGWLDGLPQVSCRRLGAPSLRRLQELCTRER